MKTFYIIIILFFTQNLNATAISNSDLQFLRTTYYSAVENENDIELLNSFIKSQFGNDINNYPALILAYIAGIEALNSKHSFWITTKYKYLVKSMELFNKAVEKDPDDLEIRFMRFSILHYVPGIVGYSNERESDLNTIYNLLIKRKQTSVPNDIQLGMVQFLIDSDRLDEKQTSELLKLKNNMALK